MSSGGLGPLLYYKSPIPLSRFLAKVLSNSEYRFFQFDRNNLAEGILIFIKPFVSGSGELVTGAAGNGPIYVFLSKKGSVRYLGEMRGAMIAEHG